MSVVPVEVVPAERGEAGRVQGEMVQVEVSGVLVRVEAGASQQLVARVLRAVKEVQGC